MDWIQVAEHRAQWWAIMKTVMNGLVPWNAENFWTIWLSTYWEWLLVSGVSGQGIRCR